MSFEEICPRSKDSRLVRAVCRALVLSAVFSSLEANAWGSKQSAFRAKLDARGDDALRLP